MKTTSKTIMAILYVSLLTFISFVTYILYINQEVFFTAWNRSEFLYGSPFFHTMTSKPFGLVRYVGAFLTQLFYKPALGSVVLSAIWALIFIVGVKAFRLKGNASALMILPIACLLTSVVDLGYWIYVSTIRGYWFSQSIGFLAMLLLLWAARCTPRKWHSIWYLIAFGVYPVLGWFTLLFVICLILVEKLTWREMIGILVIFFSASAWHKLLYSNLVFDDVVLAGLPRFITASDKTEHLTIPFLLLAAVSAVIASYSSNLDKGIFKNSIIKCSIPILCVIAGISYTWSQMYSSKNYIDEMRMVRYASDDNWKEVLNIASESSKPTTSMIMLKNVALMNEGGLLERSFKMGNSTTDIYNPDTVHVSFLEIAAPIVYYNYGLLNEAIRLNFECAVQSGFCPFYLKSLSRCTMATGEKEQSDHYATMIQHTLFNSDWQPAPASAKTCQLQSSYSDELTGVENTDSYLVNSISLWHDTDNKLAAEQALFFSMLRCDSHRFWPSLRSYIKTHMNETFPISAQEAYILYLDKAPEKKRTMIAVEQKTYDRYKQFWSSLEENAKSGLSKKEIQEKMRLGYGDTYWYYNIFGHKIF